MRRHPRRERLRAEWKGSRLALLRGEDRLVPAAPAMAPGFSEAGGAARDRWRLQCRTRGCRCLGSQSLPWRDARLAARARGVVAALSVGACGYLSRETSRGRAVFVVGLPRGRLPQELRNADRSA